MLALTSKSAMERKKAEISCIAPGRGQVERTGTPVTAGAPRSSSTQPQSYWRCTLSCILLLLCHFIIMPGLFYVRWRTSTKEVPKNKDMSLCELKYPSYTAYLRDILNPVQAGVACPSHLCMEQALHPPCTAKVKIGSAPRDVLDGSLSISKGTTMKIDGEILKKVVSPWKHREHSNVLIMFKFSAKWWNRDFFRKTNKTTHH